MKIKLSLFLVFLVCSTIVYSQHNSTIIHANNEDFINYISQFDNELIIDARDSSDFNNRIIMGAIFAPTYEILKKTTDTLDYSTPILVYCFKGKRSLQACEELILKGFTTVINLKEGLCKWDNQQYPLVIIKNE